MGSNPTLSASGCGAPEPVLAGRGAETLHFKDKRRASFASASGRYWPLARERREGVPLSEIESIGETSLPRLTDRSLFLGVLVLVTIGPMLFITLLAPQENQGTGVSDLFGFLLVFSTMHVALTAYFYVNADYRKRLLEQKIYYFWLPLIVFVCAGLSVLFLQYVGKVYLFVFYHAWLLFHYGRQNFGVLSFVGISTKGERPLNSERIALHLAPIGGILGAHALIPEFHRTIAGPYLEYSVGLGKLATVAALSAALIAAVHHIRNKATPWRIGMILMLACFYLPTFFFDNYMQAIMSYAVAHALQYFVFMYFLAAGDSKVSASRSLIVLAACGIIGWAFILAMRERSLWQSLSPEMDRFMVGAALGLVMWHFIVDAGVWKLSNKWFRGQCFDRMKFLFDRPAQ